MDAKTYVALIAIGPNQNSFIFHHEIIISQEKFLVYFKPSSERIWPTIFILLTSVLITSNEHYYWLFYGVKMERKKLKLDLIIFLVKSILFVKTAVFSIDKTKDDSP